MGVTLSLEVNKKAGSAFENYLPFFGIVPRDELAQTFVGEWIRQKSLTCSDKYKI